jgi:drug/metabolite transporter (DMT)-like permease
MLTATMACLALNHVVGRGVHESAPPIGLSFWRWTIAALLVAGLVAHGLRPKLKIFWRHGWLFLGLGALMVGSTTLFLWTLQFTQAMNVSVINALQPAMTVALTFALLGQRLAPIQVVGILIGFIGVMAIVSQGSLQVLTGLDFNRGDVVALIAVLGLSGYAICLRWLPAELSPLEALLGIIVAGCIVILPAYAAETILLRPFPLTSSTFGAVLAMGTIGSVAGNLMWNIGNQVLGPNKASIFINLIPVFGAVMAILFLNETLRAYHAAGFALICAGVWAVLARRLMASAAEPKPR